MEIKPEIKFNNILIYRKYQQINSLYLFNCNYEAPRSIKGKLNSKEGEKVGGGRGEADHYDNCPAGAP